MTNDQPYHGLFVGLVTLDLVYQVHHPPARNQKLVASDYTVSAGGPATNAAVTFSYLGNRAMLLAGLGAHPMTHLIRTDLEQAGVAIADLSPHRLDPPSVSSILVTEATGERAVVSINAVKFQVTPDQSPEHFLEGVNIVLIDGHQMAVGHAIAQAAKLHGIPIAIDAGSWKPGFETILPYVDYAICSANFHPQGCQSDAEVVQYLRDLGIAHIAITHGDQPIFYRSGQTSGLIPVPSIQAVDTLGAGDILHGAFCHYSLQTDFTTALEKAAAIAAQSCQFFGTRRWMGDSR
jgi:sugar/nucleoside kinase (ribokinase family)